MLSYSPAPTPAAAREDVRHNLNFRDQRICSQCHKMAEENEWKPMSGSRRFGIYTETVDKPVESCRKKCCVFGIIFVAGIIVFSLTALSITTGRGRKPIRATNPIKVEVGKVSSNWTTVANSGGINATDWAKTDGDPSLPRPDVSAGEMRSLGGDEDPDVDVLSTPNAFNESGSADVPQEATEQALTSRQGRIINDQVHRYQMRAPPKYPPPIHFDNIPVNIEDHFKNSFYQDDAEHSVRGNGKDPVNFSANDRQTISTFPQVPTIKFTGVYVRGPPEEIENMSLDDEQTQLNGHAYTTDPFKAYKPAHPSEINHLATSPSELNTGPRFSNKGAKPSLSTLTDGVGSGSNSVAYPQSVVFPLDPSVVRFPSLPPLPTQPSLLPLDNNKSEQKGRPLKIMLDIYPLHPSSQMADHAASNLERPVRMPTHPPRYQRQPTLPDVPQPSQPNRMIVHLNLFPRKTRKNSSQRRTTPYPLMSFVPGGGRQLQDRVSQEEDDETTSILKRPNKTSNNGTSDVSIEIAETYPEEFIDENDESLTILDNTQTEPSRLPYHIVIGKERRKGPKEDFTYASTTNSDHNENEREFFNFDGGSEKITRRGKSKSDSGKAREDRPEETDKENEKSRNEFKIVQLEVSSGDGDVINERGIVRSGASRDIGGQIMGGSHDGVYHAQFTKMDNSSFAPGIDVIPAENYWKESDGVLTGPSPRDEVEGPDENINKDEKDSGNRWLGTMEDGFSFSDDEEIPIGTAVDIPGISELGITHQYEEGGGTESGFDNEDEGAWWTEQSGSPIELPSTTRSPPIVFPTSILPLPLQMTSPVMRVEETSLKPTKNLMKTNVSSSEWQYSTEKT